MKRSGGVSCILTRCTYAENLEVIQPLVWELWHILAPNVGVVGHMTRGGSTYVESFRTIAPAVSKHDNFEL
jgi:hypothetical protein